MINRASISSLAIALAGLNALPPTAVAMGKISRNVYRIPYADSVGIQFGSNDYVGHNGNMDSVAVHKVCTAAAATPCRVDTDCTSTGGICRSGFCIQPCIVNAECSQAGGECDYVVVAPADGIVCQIIEHYDDCGCHASFGPFGNNMAILHANGEMTRFLHIQQWSASLFGITAGIEVEAGQPVAVEGAVGRTCGNTSPARSGSCLAEAKIPLKACENTFPFVACESNDDCTGEEEKCKTTNCGRHLHWNITDFKTGELINPFTCGIPDNIYKANSTEIAPCGIVPPSYATHATFPPTVLSGFGTFRVLQSYSTITAGAANISKQASLVFHAGETVILGPGFHIEPDSYFRAEIGSPDVTAPSSRPMPAGCPCSEAVSFCYQWSDPSAPDGVTQGCAVPGPSANKCHGCADEQRCCSCKADGDCQP